MLSQSQHVSDRHQVLFLILFRTGRCLDRDPPGVAGILPIRTAGASKKALVVSLASPVASLPGTSLFDFLSSLPAWTVRKQSSIKCVSKTPRNGIAGRRGNKMGRVGLFGRQNMCDSIATSGETSKYALGSRRHTTTKSRWDNFF